MKPKGKKDDLMERLGRLAIDGHRRLGRGVVLVLRDTAAGINDTLYLAGTQVEEMLAAWHDQAEAAKVRSMVSNCDPAVEFVAVHMDDGRVAAAVMPLSRGRP